MSLSGSPSRPPRTPAFSRAARALTPPRVIRNATVGAIYPPCNTASRTDRKFVTRVLLECHSDSHLDSLTKTSACVLLCLCLVVRACHVVLVILCSSCCLSCPQTNSHKLNSLKQSGANEPPCGSSARLKVLVFAAGSGWCDTPPVTLQRQGIRKFLPPSRKFALVLCSSRRSCVSHRAHVRRQRTSSSRPTPVPPLLPPSSLLGPITTLTHRHAAILRAA